MNLPTSRFDLFVRALAAVCAVGITSLIVAVHAVDLSVLGRQAASTAPNPTVVATSTASPRATW